MLARDYTAPNPQKTTLVSWGSTYYAICEAVDILLKERLSVNFLHLNELWPFPVQDVVDALDRVDNSYVIENNATGQLAHLIQAETGRKINRKILKYDGRPFTPSYIANEIKKGGSV